MLPEDKFLCAALINSNTRAVADEIAALGDLEADYIVATAPYYHAASQADILEHSFIFRASLFKKAAGNHSCYCNSN